ncbi:MAG: chitobiase/beta-hexosaminidase C-terminal domain-containing protein [Chloroflexota bacterium]
MTKIRDIVQINSGYTSYVDIYEDYYDLVKNRGRMERYKPIAAHRQVFQNIANALNPLDRRFYFLSGSYGTGKSHLLLMLANYFASPSDVPEMEAFFKNYETAQNEVLLRPGEVLKERRATSLKEARKSGCYVVAICRNLSHDFEGAMLRSLEEALQKDGSTFLLDTHYSEALRRIKGWETRRAETRFYTDFETAIRMSYPDWTINGLIDGLERYEEQALKAFKTCFHAVTDSDFTYQKDNLRDIITDFLKNPVFQEKYKGIVFIYDEFGDAIDAGRVNYTTLLDFAQYCASSTLEKGGTVLFIGAGHMAFRNHGTIGNLNAETLEARVTEIGLQTQGMEDIISGIVQPKKESAAWLQYVQPQSGKFTWFSGECNRLRLFNWLPAPKIKNSIIHNIYPMHPLATYALLRMASEAGSDNRSVSRFFAPEFETGEQGWRNVQYCSYPWFLEQHAVVENNKLALYTADMLVDYFKESLHASNNRLTTRVKNAVVNYEATLRELNGYLARKSEQQLFEEADELIQRIIKGILINEIISIQDVPIANTAENIEFALDFVAPEEKKQVEYRLKLLCEAGILFFNQGIYELVRSDRIDVQRLVTQFKSNPDNRPTHLLQSFLEFSPLRNDELYLEARDYNASFSEDKRLKVIFATPAMLSEQRPINGVGMSFFAVLELERKQIPNASNSYDGAAVYLCCENENDIEAAKRSAAQNDQKRIVLAIPRVPISIYDAIYTLKAMDSDWYRTQAQDFSPYEKAEEKKIRDETNKVLLDARGAYFSNIKVSWYGLHGMAISVQENKRHDVANQMMMERFGDKRNTFGHIEFNKSHINLSGQTRAILKEAGDILCDFTQPIRLNWTWADNRGGTKYLRKCFVEHQALRILSTQGDIRTFEAERELNKFRTALPAYAKLLEDLAALERKPPLNLLQFLKPYFEEYGQGEIAVTLMLLLARRFYGDSLRFKREPNHLADLKFNSTEDMLSLILGQSPSAVILYETVSSEDQAYFAKIAQIFSDQPATAGKVYTISEDCQAITHWWEGLPAIARSLNFYNGQDKSLAEAFSQVRTKDSFHLIKHDLLEILEQTPGELLNPTMLSEIEIRLTAFKNTAESIQTNIEEQILIQIAEIFGSPSHLDVDIQDALKNWHHGLSSSQKDALGSYHDNDSKPLVKHTGYANIHELLFITLPEAYSLGRVNIWTTHLVSNYIQRIRNGKGHIETNAPQVSQIKVDFTNALSQHGNQVKYQGELVLHADTEDGQGVIYYTEDGSDPATSNHRQKLTPGDTLTIQGNRKLKLVVADEKGNYSSVKTIEAIDELEKHKIIRSVQKPAFGEPITFIFPENQEAAWTTIYSLIAELRKAGLYSPSELRRAFLRALGEDGG